MATSKNTIGLEVKTNIEDYPHLTLVENEKASGYAYDINKNQFEVLVKFKQSCLEENLVPNFDYFDDYYLLKFCRARKFILEKVLKFFRNFIEWRRKEDVDNIDLNFHYTENLEVRKIFPHGYHKTDKKGRPLYYQMISKIDVEKMLKVTTEDRLIRHLVQEYEQVMKYKLKACSKAKGELIEQYTIILDLEGIGISSLFGSQKNFVVKILKVGQDYYPENMAKMFLINTNSFFSLLYNIVKNFIDPKSVAKIDVLGKDYQSKLLEYIDADNLPSIFGGNCVCPEIEGGCLFSDYGPWNPDGQLIT